VEEGGSTPDAVDGSEPDRESAHVCSDQAGDTASSKLRGGHVEADDPQTAAAQKLDVTAGSAPNIRDPAARRNVLHEQVQIVQ
jgi:hypothetical protein